MPTSTAERTTGLWTWILPELGVAKEFLVDVHGPCPRCEGTDRFRFDDKEGRGTWFCNQCGSGDGFDLLTLVTGRDFKDLAGEIDKIIDRAPKASPFRAEVSVEKKRKALNATWITADNSELVTEYLLNRGIAVPKGLSDLRGHNSLSFIDKKSGMRDRFPAMLALVRNKDGEPVSIHRTYLLPDGKRVKKLMPGTEKISGGAVRLIDPGEGVLLVAEGIESAMAGREVYWRRFNKRGNAHIGVWSTVSAGLMKDVVIPEEVRHLIVCADSDFSFTGQAAAFDLAKRFIKPGRTCQVGMPSKVGADMVDVLHHQGGEEIWQGVAHA